MMIFLTILIKDRNASAPGLNDAPKTSKFLFKTFQTCFKRWEILIQWWSAQEIYIPKVSTQSNSPLNVKGKLFFWSNF